MRLITALFLFLAFAGLAFADDKPTPLYIDKLEVGQKGMLWRIFPNNKNPAHVYVKVQSIEDENTMIVKVHPDSDFRYVIEYPTKGFVDGKGFYIHRVEVKETKKIGKSTVFVLKLVDNPKFDK